MNKRIVILLLLVVVAMTAFFATLAPSPNPATTIITEPTKILSSITVSLVPNSIVTLSNDMDEFSIKTLRAESIGSMTRFQAFINGGKESVCTFSIDPVSMAKGVSYGDYECHFSDDGMMMITVPGSWNKVATKDLPR